MCCGDKDEGSSIYDFDGVIADSEVLANAVLAEIVTELGRPTTAKLVTNASHGLRCTRQLHRSLTDVQRGGFSWTTVLNTAVNRKAAINHRTSNDRRNTFRSGHQSRCLSIVEVGSTYVGIV
jgi:beta-phosphoglucomutase-like phosphatase (HAD superfamily)